MDGGCLERRPTKNSSRVIHDFSVFIAKSSSGRAGEKRRVEQREKEVE